MMKYHEFFQLLTGREPFPYQARLGTEPWPDLLDVPTGLGKTAAILVAWLYKRLTEPGTTETRLAYCLPMRVLARQTEESARLWCAKAAVEFEAAGVCLPHVHLLLGGDVDDEWENAPEKPAMLIGTQDMLLSRSLNRGYAMSRYKWPVHFALLNNDCLWVFDETQLVGVGIETSAQLDGLRRKLGTHNRCHTVWMSATLGESQLSTVDHPRPASGWAVQRLQADDLDSALVQTRVSAKKPIARLDGVRLDKETDKGPYIASLVKFVLSQHAKRSGLTLVIVNRVQRAQAIYDALRKASGRTDENTALIHSRFRAPDRTRHERVLQDTEGDRIVVATQAIEAGVDVSARTLITELAPWSSLVQRLGRCNRYGGEEVAAYWVDVDTSETRSGLQLPYEAPELDQARRLLAELTDAGGDAGPGKLQKVDYTPTEVVRSVLRRKDLLDLFDTSPDLSGYDIDVSRFVRDGEDTDVQFFWREFEGDPTEQASPHRDELCRVRLPAARDFVTKVNKRYDASKVGSTQNRVWRWDPLDKQWRAVTSVHAGQMLLLHGSVGGYDPQLGWTGIVGPRLPTQVVATPLEAAPPDADESDAPSNVGRWVALEDHLGHVRDEASSLASAMGLVDCLELLATAGLWHDVGKAHDAFQSKLLGPLENKPELLPKGSGPWAKSNHRLKASDSRKHFRHELASALAWLAVGDGKDERSTNLVAYLVAAHHGKVRLSIRSLPDERAPDDPDRLFARGVWDSDELLTYTLPDGRRFEAVSLDLSPMRLGKGSWLERMLALRDADDLGPFRLALLETVVRVADWRASRKEQEGGYDG